MQKGMKLVVLDRVGSGLDRRLRDPALPRPPASGALARLQGDAVSDAVEPGTQRALLADPQRRRPTDQDQERGLERILGRVGIAEHLPADGPDQTTMARQDRLEGGFHRLVPPVRESLDQLTVGQPDGAARAEEPAKLPADLPRRWTRHGDASARVDRTSSP